jgi:glycosyltransferase involved in cell wall biosynthesis
MALNPLVSVILPVYNGQRYVSAAIESALAQTYRPIEVVIVNDGSTDHSYETIEPYLNLPDVKYLQQENRGVAAARNAGIRHSKGELVAFLDQDDLWLPEKLALQVGYLQQNPEIAMVHSNQRYINGDGGRIQFPGWETDAQGMCLKELFIKNRIAVLTVVVRKHCLDEVGPLNESLSGCDDYELWLRIAARFPIGHIDKELALYRFHDCNVSRDLFRMTMTDLAAIQSFVKIFPDINRVAGQGVVRQRLGELNFQLGGWYMWRARNFKAARRHFLESLKNMPLHWTSYRHLFWCCISASERRALAWYWHRIKTAWRTAA